MYELSAIEILAGEKKDSPMGWMMRALVRLFKAGVPIFPLRTIEGETFDARTCKDLRKASAVEVVSDRDLTAGEA